jgi:hypothetical protein
MDDHSRETLILAFEEETGLLGYGRRRRGRSESVPRVGRSVIAKARDFPSESDEGGGFENPCRILTFYGEVAERLKAAVC